MYRWLGVLVFVSNISLAQRIDGKILDSETRLPVPFASIGILGTSSGTSSNVDGEFSLVISRAASIKVTCIGYETRTLSSTENLHEIWLKPVATELNTVIIYKQTINAKRVARKAFSEIENNALSEDFFQNFFYRHYCKDGSTYGRLIEAYVDVWKHDGDRTLRKGSGEREEIRVTQLRRSLDNTVAAQGHPPISVGSALLCDIMAYQAKEESRYLKMYDEVSDVKVNAESYSFTFGGATIYDGQEIFIIMYDRQPDSVLTTSGYQKAPGAKGTLFVTTDRYAIVKAEEERTDGANKIRTMALYKKHGEKYFAYHLMREGENQLSDGTTHTFHIELMSLDIQQEKKLQFAGHEPGKEELLKIPFDSLFWKQSSILKSTPLEDNIIHDLGQGSSLNDQFSLYKQYQWSISDGGTDGESKFKWFVDYQKGRHPVYVTLWDSNCKSCISEMEYIKRLQKLYRGQMVFALISIDEEDTKWKQTIERYNLFSDGLFNFRISKSSATIRSFKARELPAYILIRKNGTSLEQNIGYPHDPVLERVFEKMLKE